MPSWICDYLSFFSTTGMVLETSLFNVSQFCISSLPSFSIFDFNCAKEFSIVWMLWSCELSIRKKYNHRNRLIILINISIAIDSSFPSIFQILWPYIQNPTMKKLLFLISLLGFIISITATDPEAALQFFEYCSYHNYPVEDHIIPTEDHYNLQYYRIQAKNTKITNGKRVIYLQHGLVDSSDTWIVNNQSLAPAFYLANKGFDVWLGNSRGNRYSTKKMSPVVLDFWNFSFDQMARYDLPAAFRYITRVTQRKIHYIGHSQGTLIMFIALAEKIKGIEESLLSYNAFGPVAYVKHQSSQLLGQLSKTSLVSILAKSHVKWLFMESESAMKSAGALCKIDPYPCIAGLRLISEMNNTVNNLHRLPVIMAHFPSGSSTKNFQHFQQFVRTEVFNNFDYGKRNQAVYGQKTPPVYNLSKITASVHLHVGVYDKLADVKDSTRLFNELTNSPNKTMKTYQFGHATFIWGKTLEHVDNALAFINQAEPLSSQEYI